MPVKENLTRGENFNPVEKDFLADQGEMEIKPRFLDRLPKPVKRALTGALAGVVLASPMVAEVGAQAENTKIDVSVVDTIDLNTFGGESVKNYESSLRKLGCEDEDRIGFSAKVLNLWDYGYNGDLDSNYKFQSFLPYKDVIRYAIDGQNREVFYDREGKPLFWLSNFDFDSRLRENLSAAVTWLEENEAADALDKLAANGGCLLFTALTQPDKDENAVWMNKWGEISFNIGPETSGDLDNQEIRDVFIKGLLVASVTAFDARTEVMELETEDSPEAALDSYRKLAGEIDWEDFKLAPVVVTQEYKNQVIDEILDYQKPEPTPIPTEQVQDILEAWKEETFGPYRQELKDLGAEDKDRINFGAKMLYAWDNSKGMKGWNDGKEKFQNHLSREEIIDFVLTGENEDVFCDENGKPMVWQVIADKKAEPRVEQAFKASLEWYADNGAPDALESMCNNGFCIFFAAVSDPERGPGFLLTEHGIISPNMDSENIKILKDKGLRNILNMGLMVESYGIAYLQIVKALGLSGFSLVGNAEVVKSLMAAYVAESMTSVYKEYVIYSEEFFGKAENFANNFSLSLDDPWITRQLELMADLVDPIGFSSLREAKAFNEAIGAET